MDPSCLSGGAESPFRSASSTASFSSSSSTISETSNCSQGEGATTISTKKPRTRRKRPNQIYNEAAMLLSAAYPNLFSTEKLKKPIATTKTESLTNEEQDSSESLLLPLKPCDSSSFSLHRQTQRKPVFQAEQPNRVLLLSAKGNYLPWLNCHRESEADDFDCESILDEEIEEGIDSILGDTIEELDGERGIPLLRFDFGGKIEFREEGAAPARALRRGGGGNDGGSWWNIPAVQVVEVSPGIKKPPSAASVPAMDDKKNKTMKRKEKKVEERNEGLMLRLNYESVRRAWKEKGSPFAGGVRIATTKLKRLVKKVNIDQRSRIQHLHTHKKRRKKNKKEYD